MNENLLLYQKQIESHQLRESILSQQIDISRSTIEKQREVIDLHIGNYKTLKRKNLFTTIKVGGICFLSGAVLVGVLKN